MAKLLIVGHRGAKGLAPENTIESLQMAIDLKVDMIEFDVHVTSDGIPVVHHDPSIIAIEKEVFIKQITFSEFKKLRPASPTLQEVLVKFGKKIDMMVEVKPQVDTRPVISILKDHLKDKAHSRLLLASFDFNVLKDFKQALPQLDLVVLEKYFGTRATNRARKLGTIYLNMPDRVLWWGFIKPISKHYRLFAYNLDDPKKARKWANYGLSGTITNFPDRFTRPPRP